MNHVMKMSLSFQLDVFLCHSKDVMMMKYVQHLVIYMYSSPNPAIASGTASRAWFV